MNSTIYHNPKCSTSRFVLEIMQLAGETPEIVLYQQVGWTEDLLRTILTDAKLSARDILRTRNTPAKELGLMDPATPDSEILRAMVADPMLVERPIVRTSEGVVLCRPKEVIFSVLNDQSPRTLMTAKGESFQIPWDEILEQS
ncbi:MULTISPECIES: arsenate reductase family protein [Falsihalocynthiibacter]|uniref:arsenate reductase family protein n=1 Tax=Falsihalocynthiibacter TaxID=2854182 RepID=UPI003001E308